MYSWKTIQSSLQNNLAPAVFYFDCKKQNNSKFSSWFTCMTKDRIVPECNPNDSVWTLGLLILLFCPAGKKKKEGDGKDEGFFIHSETKLWSRCIKTTNLIDINILFSTQQLQGRDLQEKCFWTSFWMTAMTDLVSIYYRLVFCVAIYISTSWL